MTPDVRHKHLVVRAEISNPPQPANNPLSRWFACRQVRKELKSLIEQIQMKIMFGPRAEYCTVKGNRGMTAFAIIETSHCVLHTWDECGPAIIQLDVYTCSDLNVDDVLDWVRQFKPTKLEYKFIDRENGLHLISEKKAA